MDSIKLNGKTVRYKPGAMRRQMALKTDEKLSSPKLRKIADLPTGKKFSMFGRQYTATPLLKRRASFGLTLMRR